MVTNLLNIPRTTGDLISRAIEEFAEERSRGPDHYDLWHHDEPVWILRDWRPLASARRVGPQPRLVIRVQLAAFDTDDPLTRFQAIPDAHILADGRITQRLPKSARGILQAHSGILLDALESAAWAKKFAEEIHQELRKLIAVAWAEAESLGTQIRPSK